MQVFIVPHEGTDPRSVVQAAVTRRNQLKREKRWTEGDSAWAVFDGEEHYLHDPANWNDALQIAGSNGVQLAISNPCFELWYLLHFQDQFAYLTRQQARQMLKRYMPDYEKSSKLYPEPLQERTREAIRRAKEIEVRAKDNALSPHENPWCGVTYLVESLLALSKRDNP